VILLPGPDGFSMVFFQACWDMIKTDIMRVFHDFHACNKFERSLNAMFISLISKKSGAIDLKDFWHVSLVSGVYKIIAKVLASRLRRLFRSPRMPLLKVGKSLIYFFVANECLDSMIRFGEPGVLCKLDIEKAYDHVNWGSF
jgi:hypothetical protein